jgi:WD40 repeat protein/serine/threonine protein kinase
MRGCISEARLRQFLNTELPSELQARVADHIADCVACQDKLEKLTLVNDPRLHNHFHGDDPAVDIESSELLFLTDLQNAASLSASRDELDHANEPGSTLLHAVGPLPESEVAALRPGPPGYEIVRELGRGGMGVVYAARHAGLGRQVALKMILAGEMARTDEMARFRAEAEIIAHLKHPNIVQVYEIGDYEGKPFFTIELVDGPNLSQFLAGGALPARQAAELVRTLANAVHYAHQHGIIHRDLKPSNVLLETQYDGRANGHPPNGRGPNWPDEGFLSALRTSFFIAKIADFGLARRLDQANGQTQTGMILGTPNYMPPELAAGKRGPVGTYCDVYSLGAILYECLTGLPPFRGETPTDTVMLVLHNEPENPARLQPGLPRDLTTICLKCLEKDPARRYAGAAAFADDLRRFLAGRSVVARPATFSERVWRWSKRRPAWAALGLMVLLVFGLGLPAVTGLWLRADSERRAKEEQSDRADAARQQAEASLYAGRIALADHAYESNDLEKVAWLLDRCRPEPGQPDLRGWEWQYLRRLCHPDLVPGMRHEGATDAWLNGIAANPDASRLVTVSGLPPGLLSGHLPEDNRIIPGTLKLWDSETGLCLQTLKPHAGAIWNVSFSPNGKFLATGSADGTVALWDAGTLTKLRALPTRPSDLGMMAFSPDSRLLAAGTTRTVLVWDVASGKNERRFDFNEDPTKLAFSADSGRLAVVLRQRELHTTILDLATGKEIPHSIPDQWGAAISYSPDGRSLALSHSSAPIVRVWDAAGNHLRHQFAGHNSLIQSLAFSPAGPLATGSDDRTVRLWDLERGAESLALRGHLSGVIGLAFNRQGTRLYSAGRDQEVKIWDVTHDPRGVRIQATTFLGEFLGNLTFSNDGRQILAVVDPPAGKTDYRVGAWNAATGAPEQTFDLPIPFDNKKPHRLFAFSASADWLAGADRTNPRLVRVFDAHNGSVRSSIQSRLDVARRIALSDDGKLVAFASFDAQKPDGSPSRQCEITLAETQSGVERWHVPLSDGKLVTTLTFNHTGNRLAVALGRIVRQDGPAGLEWEGEIQVWDTFTAQPVLEFESKTEDRIDALAFSPDDSRLASAVGDKTVRVWHARTGKPLYGPLNGSTNFTGLAFSPDGRRLAATGMDNHVRLWDVDSGNELLLLWGFGRPGSGNYGFTARVAFSPDGRRLASNNWDGTINVWDAGRSE